MNVTRTARIKFMDLSNSTAVIAFVRNYFIEQFASVVEYTKEAAEHFFLAVVLYLLTCLLLYLAIVRWKTIKFKSQVQSSGRVLLVTAHPDDECMFFGPTILNLMKHNCTVYLMCLSRGANYNAGKVRKKELFRACQALGMTESCIILRSHTLLPDSMVKKWPVELIAQMILDQVEKYSIDTVITFDKHGVSRHLNHCSIYYAVTYLVTENNLPEDCKVYVLESVNVLRKYWLILDIPICYLLSRHRYILDAIDCATVKNAMREHQSQLVWFRRLYLIFSRYILINTLQEVELTDLELEIELDD